MCAMFKANQTSFKKGQAPWNKGKKLSDEFKKKLSESRLKSEFRTGELHPRWKGGVQKHHGGYKSVFLPGERFNKRLEHRVVVERLIGRRLSRKEVVHHIGETSDNRPEMLIVFSSNSAHMRFHYGKKVQPEEIIFDGRAYNAGIVNVINNRIPKTTQAYFKKYGV